MSKFAAEMTQTFVSATCADVFTAAMMNGISGGKALDLPDAVLNGLQTGTGFIAYPVAEHLLEKFSLYREKKGKNQKVFVYAANAVGAAAIIASMNYPITKLQEKRKTGKTTVSVTEFGNMFVDQILPNVGFPVVADALEAKIRVPKDSLSNWFRGSFILCAGSLGGSIANLPLAMAKGGIKELPETITGFVKSIPATLASNDAFGHFTKITSCISGQ